MIKDKLQTIISKFSHQTPEENSSEVEAIPEPNSRRQFFRQGLFSALAVGGLSQLQTSARASTPAASTGSQAARGVGAAATMLDRPTEFNDIFRKIKREASPEELFTFLYDMPKGGDVHHHLGGGMLPELWYELATDKSRNGNQEFYTRYRVLNYPDDVSAQIRGGMKTMFWSVLHEKAYDSLPANEQAEFKPMSQLTQRERELWMASVYLDREQEGRDEFFEYIWSRLNHLLRSIHVMTELTVENMKRFGAEGVRYMELMTGPDGWRDEHNNPMSREAATAFWKKRLSQPDAVATGVKIRFKCTVLRFNDNALDKVEDYFAFIDSDPHDIWTSIDMAGREDDNRGFPQRFTEVYDKVLRRYPGVGISIHAGEAEKPDTYIFDTLRLGATRIGHGINLIRDPETMQLMRCGKFMIEINLISNHLLKYVPDPSQHPFPVYLRQGIPCCLNTDDRGMWHSNMTDEYYLAVTQFNLSWDEILLLGRNSLKFAFMPESLRAQLQADFESDMAAFEKKYSGDWRAPLKAVKPVTYNYGKKYFGLNL